MFVWHWVQQHRLLSVIFLALIMVSCAGGTAWALVFRTVSSPVGLREALRMYRKEQTGKIVTSLRNRLPAPGVYTYRTTGGESLNLVGVARSFPTSTSMIVADGRCATVSWVPITAAHRGDHVLQHPQRCVDRSEARDGRVHRRLHEHLDDQLPGLDLPAPAGGAPGAALGGHLLQVNPAEKIMLSGQALGRSTMPVGGHAVSVTHARLVFTFTGTAEHGTNPIDFWIVPSSGLIVREKETVGVTQGGVRYSENMETTLTALSPAH